MESTTVQNQMENHMENGIEARVVLGCYEPESKLLKWGSRRLYKGVLQGLWLIYATVYTLLFQYACVRSKMNPEFLNPPKSG